MAGWQLHQFLLSGNVSRTTPTPIHSIPPAESQAPTISRPAGLSSLAEEAQRSLPLAPKDLRQCSPEREYPAGVPERKIQAEAPGAPLRWFHAYRNVEADVCARRWRSLERSRPHRCRTRELARTALYRWTAPLRTRNGPRSIAPQYG